MAEQLGICYWIPMVLSFLCLSKEERSNSKSTRDRTVFCLLPEILQPSLMEFDLDLYENALNFCYSVLLVRDLDLGGPAGDRN